MLELADLLGIIHIPEYKNFHGSVLRKTNVTISPQLKQEIKEVGTKKEVVKLPAGTVCVNKTPKSQKQTREISYLPKNHNYKTAEKKTFLGFGALAIPFQGFSSLDRQLWHNSF